MRMTACAIVQADTVSIKAMMKQVQGENRDELQQHEFRALMAHSMSSASSGGAVPASEANAMSFQQVSYFYLTASK